MTSSDKIGEATLAELREVLCDFWLGVVDDRGIEITERLKASELLAKHILLDGKTPVKRRGSSRPSTAEILRLAAQLEGGNGKQGSPKGS